MNDQGALNTDREIWREREGDYYADSIHVTKGGGIGLNCGGTVYVKPVREWHKLAAEVAELTKLAKEQGQEIQITRDRDEALESEVERLRGAIEESIETLEAMDLHVDNPLYERMCAALQSTDGEVERLRGAIEGSIIMSATTTMIVMWACWFIWQSFGFSSVGAMTGGTILALIYDIYRLVRA